VRLKVEKSATAYGNNLFIFHLVRHVAAAFLIAHLGVHVSDLLLVAVGYSIIYGVGISVSAHRLFSHRSFAVHPSVERFLAVLTCLAGQGSPILWASIHRGWHHKFTDESGDRHSPIHGFASSYLGWLKSIDRESLPVRSCEDLVKSRFHRFLHRNYFFIYLSVTLALFSIDARFATYAFLIPSILSFHGVAVVNFFCHSRQFGYRNFETGDNSVNLRLLGILCFGEGYHNNHHHEPDRASFGIQKSELDLGSLIIKLISKPYPKRKSISEEH